MKYKVGDEVLVKVRIVEDSVFGYGLRTHDGILFMEKKDGVIPVPDMTAEEAWEIAKKLFADYSNVELDEIFGKGWSFPKLMELTPQQAKAKIEAWEAEKEIKVGDEVVVKSDPYNDYCKFFVTHMNYRENEISGVSGFDGGVFCGRRANQYQKTGRHIDIGGLMKQIGGDE